MEIGAEGLEADWSSLNAVQANPPRTLAELGDFLAER